MSQYVSPAKEDYTITELTSIRTQLFICPSEEKNNSNDFKKLFPI